MFNGSCYGTDKVLIPRNVYWVMQYYRSGNNTSKCVMDYMQVKLKNGRSWW